MIKNFWYAVISSDDLKNEPLGVKRFGRKLVFWRDEQGNVQATDDRCLHRRAELSAGRVVDGEIECPFHGFRFNGTGACTRIPANGREAKIPSSLRIPSYQVREQQGLIWMWWGEADKSTPRLPWFEEIKDKGVPYVEISRESPIGFCRMMENNMDFAHFAFVHKRYFTAETENVYAKDFTTRIQGDRIDFHGFLSQDPAENRRAKKKDIEIIASVLFPNMAKYDSPLDQDQNQTVVWVAPVDNETCWFNFRVYMAPGPFLGLRRFIKKYIVLRLLWLKWVHVEDLVIWKRQDPIDHGLFDVLPCPSDGMIRQYLRLYRKHLALDPEAFESDGQMKPLQRRQPASLSTSS